MSRAASTVPDEAALLCEGCGYILTGLPPDSRCPECAKPIDESSPSVRGLPAWEIDNGTSRRQRFWTTTRAVLLHPTRFYRTLATRVSSTASAGFARIHYLITSLLLGLTVCLQLHWMLVVPGYLPSWRAILTHTDTPDVGELVTLYTFGLVVAWAFCFAFLTGLTHLAARLTAWEAAYRGLRLPLAAVLRGLHYHAPHYVPVAIFAFLTVAGYQVLVATNQLSELHATRYLYLLCAEVVLGAFYLFVTYWKGMRNLLFANG